MDPYQPPGRLGTSPEPVDDTPEQEPSAELALSVRLDRPFHELKEQLVSEFERAYLARCLAASETVSAASRLSGLSRRHLRTLMAKYGMALPAGLEPDDGAGDPADPADDPDDPGGDPDPGPVEASVAAHSRSQPART